MSTIRVVVTGATGQVAYALLPRIASGEMFGPDTDIDLRLADIPQMIDKAKGVLMELEDGAYPLLERVSASSDRAETHQRADWVLLVGSVPRGPGMERGDLIRKNGPIFVDEGKAIQRYASSGGHRGAPRLEGVLRRTGARRSRPLGDHADAEGRLLLRRGRQRRELRRAEGTGQLVPAAFKGRRLVADRAERAARRVREGEDLRNGRRAREGTRPCEGPPRDLEVRAGRALHPAGRHVRALALSEFHCGPGRGSIFRERAAELRSPAGSPAGPPRANASRGPRVGRGGRCSQLRHEPAPRHAARTRARRRRVRARRRRGPRPRRIHRSRSR